MIPDPSQRFSEPPRGPGENRAPLDFDSPAHFFAARLSSQNPGVVFSSGRVPWDYVASLLVSVAQPLEQASVTVIIEASETVYLLLVDSDYRQLGERVVIRGGGGPIVMNFALLPSAVALVVQAGEIATGATVTIHKAWLQTPGK